jgi:class 3 adenylate cyclase
LKNLPARTVTFLFTDVEGSTRLPQTLGDRYADVLADYRRLLRAAAYGREVDTQGDAFFFAFPRARNALIAAVGAQRTLQSSSSLGGVRWQRIAMRTEWGRGLW